MVASATKLGKHINQFIGSTKLLNVNVKYNSDMSETNFIFGYFVLTDRSKQSDMYSMSILILNGITKINLVFENTFLTLADTWVT